MFDPRWYFKAVLLDISDKGYFWNYQMGLLLVLIIKLIEYMEIIRPYLRNNALPISNTSLKSIPKNSLVILLVSFSWKKYIKASNFILKFKVSIQVLDWKDTGDCKGIYIVYFISTHQCHEYVFSEIFYYEFRN